MAGTIVIYLDHYSRLNFFVRIVDSFPEKKFLFITAKWSIVIWLKNKGHKALLITRSKTPCCIDYPNLEKSHCVASGKVSLDYAETVFQCIFSALLELGKIYTIERFLLWNGLNVAGMAVTSFAKSKGIRCVYFELSNVCNTIMADFEGCNAYSSIYNTPSILDQYPTLSDEEKDVWLSGWRQSKLARLPQAKGLGKINKWAFLDRIGYIFLGALKEDLTLFSKQLSCIVRQKYMARFVSNHFPYLEFDGTPYIFLPLQVSTDTQVLIHSDYDNFDLLEFAYQHSLSEHLKLVVKIHPAESNLEHIQKIQTWACSHDIEIVQNNTIELIQFAECVIVNNSTVGLEARLMKKKVIVLGRAVYSNLNQEQLFKFVKYHLIQDSYFSTHPKISDSAKKQIGLYF